ncbi:MAG: hypothetical protein HZC11_06740 [Nitrospirae bacterium]|nr:hypothetical protein [Nitrospirota bacterium]
MKSIIGMKLIFAILIAILLDGCTFIVKDDHAAKYYGIDEQRGGEYLNQILEKQQQVYQTEKVSVGSKRP